MIWSWEVKPRASRRHLASFIAIAIPILGQGWFTPQQLCADPNTQPDASIDVSHPRSRSLKSLANNSTSLDATAKVASTSSASRSSHSASKPRRSASAPRTVREVHAEDSQSPVEKESFTHSRRVHGLQVMGEPHEVTIRFVHRVWNLSPQTLRGVDVGVAVPKSDVHQLVRSVDFTPPATRETTNRWGQKTARFFLDRLDSNESFEVRSTIRVSIRDLEWRVSHGDVGAYEDIPKPIRDHYLRDGTNYRLASPRIVAAAERTRIAGSGMLEQVRRIHDYVTDHLEYERDHRWDAADRVLTRGRGSCSEYAYLMIALCRLNGIPARYAGGTRIQNVRDHTSPYIDRVFHRWVEVYLPGIGWYPIDPTENDRRGAEGDYYRYFGRLPWSYLTLVHGDGDGLESGILGWDYRSSTKWSRPLRLTTGGVRVERFAVWLSSDKAEASVATPQASGPEGRSGN